MLLELAAGTIHLAGDLPFVESIADRSSFDPNLRDRLLFMRLMLDHTCVVAAKSVKGTHLLQEVELGGQSDFPRLNPVTCPRNRDQGL